MTGRGFTKLSIMLGVTAYAALNLIIYFGTWPHYHGAPIQWALGLFSVLCIVGCVFAGLFGADALDDEKKMRADAVERQAKELTAVALSTDQLPLPDDIPIDYSKLVVLPAELVAMVEWTITNADSYTKRTVNDHVSREVFRLVEDA